MGTASAYSGTPPYYSSPQPRQNDGLHGHSFTATPCPRVEFCPYPRETPGETVAAVPLVLALAGVIFLASGRKLSRAVSAWATETPY
jgi:hypothetical protein